MKRYGLFVVLFLAVLTGCKDELLTEVKIQNDMMSAFNVDNIFVEEELHDYVNEGEKIRIKSKVIMDKEMTQIFGTVILEYEYSKENKEWNKSFESATIESYKPLEEAFVMKPELGNVLGFRDVFLIGTDEISKDDDNLTIEKVATDFDKDSYCEYDYIVKYDNGLVIAEAEYKISYVFSEDSGNWSFDSNKEISPFNIELKADINKMLVEEEFLEYIYEEHKNTLKLKDQQSELVFVIDFAKDQVKLIESEDLVLDGLNIGEAVIRLEIDHDFVTTVCDVTLIYELNNIGRNIELKNIQVHEDSVVIELKENLLGHWEGYYKENDDKIFAHMELSSLSDNKTVGSGVLSIFNNEEDTTAIASINIITEIIGRELHVKGNGWVDNPKHIRFAYLVYEALIEEENMVLKGGYSWYGTDEYESIMEKTN